MSRGKLVVLEGGDAAGKKTQTELLMRGLAARGLSCGSLSFPRYKTAIGEIIAECLKGTHGDFKNADPYLSAPWYILDRIAGRHEIHNAREAFDVVVSNRYAESNFAFNAAKVPDDEQDALVRRLTEIEYIELGFIPRPDRVIYLAVSPETSDPLLEKRGEGKDQYENDPAFQARVGVAYKRIAFNDPVRWRVVNCDPNGVMRSPVDIHEEVMMHVMELTGWK